MNATERQQQILETLDLRGRLAIAELSARFEVSDMTIRRDLAQLEAEGLLRRTHGGAVRSQSGNFEPPYALRTRLNAESKRAIAVSVVAQLADGETVVLDGGSTGVAIAEELVGRKLTVCALNLRVADVLMASPATRVMVPGGEVRHGEQSFVGPAAERTLADYRFDSYVMTVSAVDMTAGLTEWNEADAAIKRAALVSSTRCIVACDSTKFGQTAFARVAAVDAADQIHTDTHLPTDVRQSLTAAGIAPYIS
ncbi:DeoR/GlpR transcriptional regulator [Gordonia sp. TBRC 11910]|uniref:Lactose phosphotransferase system repressor n=1 Tax=Gordonia asplenii TaxID=2725283 RepID=A0A848L6U0_9ACTN|nr:DeoR/GlpR family DNA-binding transcription regulator [Gordonia asplenii]NMO04413.1 DeoR/GlpR transcriptional regulator [Gordonia asplenii]